MIAKSQKSGELGKCRQTKGHGTDSIFFRVRNENETDDEKTAAVTDPIKPQRL